MDKTEQFIGFMESQYSFACDRGQVVAINGKGFHRDLRQLCWDEAITLYNCDDAEAALISRIASEELENRHYEAQNGQQTASYTVLVESAVAASSEVTVDRLHEKRTVTGKHLTVRGLGLFVWNGRYNTKDIPKAAGFRWNSNAKKWYTESRDVARRLVEYADFEARAVLGASQAHTGLDDDMVDMVHRAVREIAYKCDYAKQKDTVGFSKSDAYVGHILAETDKMDKYQATLALRLVYRHRWQLSKWLWAVLEPLYEVNKVAKEV